MDTVGGVREKINSGPEDPQILFGLLGVFTRECSSLSLTERSVLETTAISFYFFQVFNSSFKTQSMFFLYYYKDKR